MSLAQRAPHSGVEVVARQHAQAHGDDALAPVERHREGQSGLGVADGAHQFQTAPARHAHRARAIAQRCCSPAHRRRGRRRPTEAIRLGAVDEVLGLHQVADAILRFDTRV
jgi:hypothetical protein